MNLTERDHKSIWHPYTPFTKKPESLPIVKAKGAYIYDDKGRKIIDAISSWWVTTHGHAHPHISKGVAKQIATLDHVIFAGFTHEPAIELAERLLLHLPDNQKRLFYSDNGSTAVEVGLKMALQYYYNKGEKRQKIIAFENAYHGDTFGAMSVSGKSIFTAPFDDLTFEVNRIKLPASGELTNTLTALEKILSSNDVAAFIFEPLVLGAGGMLMYEAEALDKLIAACKKYDTITIADEVMTGFYRTGTFFASLQLKEQPDILCLSKGITGGTLPLGATSCSDKIFEAFIEDDISKTLFHGHSYTGNPVVCAAAIAAMDLYEKPQCLKNITRINKKHLGFLKKIKALPNVNDARLKGTILAIEVTTDEKTSYTNKLRDSITAFFMEKKILIRPLGNVIYVLPPYCITSKDLDYIYHNITTFLTTLSEE